MSTGRKGKSRRWLVGLIWVVVGGSATLSRAQEYPQEVAAKTPAPLPATGDSTLVTDPVMGNEPQAVETPPGFWDDL